MRAPKGRVGRVVLGLELGAVLALGVALGLGACSDWGGLQDVEFADPYIQTLSEDSAGSSGRTQLFRRYAAVDRAFQLEAAGELDTAAEEVAGYLALHPDDLRVRAYYLDLLNRLDRWEELVGQASLILDEAPTYVPALLARGRARAEQGDLEGAVDDLLAASQAQSIRPTDRTRALEEAVLYALARAGELEAAGRTADAAEAYATALTLPLDEEQRLRALRGRYRTTAAENRIQEARTAVEAAVDLAPSDLPTRRDAAGLALAAGDFDAAAGHLEALLAEDVSPDDRSWALDQLAVAYEKMGRPMDAAVRVEQLLRLTSRRERAAILHRRAGELFRAAGRPVRAAAHLEAAAELTPAPGRVTLLLAAARLYEEAGRLDDAFSALQSAYVASPDDASVRAEISRVLALAESRGEDLGALARIGPGAADTLSLAEVTASRRAFAAAYEQAGRVQEAMVLYQLIADSEPAGSEAWVEAMERLAALHAERGEDRASADRLMALHLEAPDREESQDGEWALHAARRYAAAGAWPEAAEAFRAARDRGAVVGADDLRRMAVVLVEVDDLTGAEQILASIPEEERSQQDFRYLAMLALEAGDTVRAVTFQQHALQRSTTAADSAAALRSIGYAQLGRDDTAAATALSQSLALEPDATARIALARAQLRLGQPDSALLALEPGPDADPGFEDRPDRLDLLAEIHAERGDTVAFMDALSRAAEAEPSAYRYNRLGFAYEDTGDPRKAAEAFENAYGAEPSAVQAAQVAFAYRRVGDDIRATEWFRRSIDDAAAEEPPDTTVDLDAMRREVAALTDRLSVALYSSFRGEGGAVAQEGGVVQAGVGSQGGLQIMGRPMAQRTNWGSDVDVFGRFFWGYGDGLSIDPDSYQGQIGIRYRPPIVPGSAVGLERWVKVGSAALDTWAVRLQHSRLLGRPYPEPDDGPTAYASLYGDASYLFESGGAYVLYGEGRPGMAVPLGRTTALLPHASVTAYHQSLAGTDRSYLEGGPGVGFRLRVPREGRYTKDFWVLELLTQYRWGQVYGDPAPADDRYGELVLTLILQF